MSANQSNLAPADPDRLGSRRRRRGLVFLAILLVGGCALFGCARWFLGSKHVLEMISARLQTVYGGRLRLADADVGLGSTSLRGLQLFETGEGHPEKPWAEVDEVKADVSIMSLLNGEAMPREVTLGSASVTLRFDDKGHLETRLPPLPTKGHFLPVVRLKAGRIVLLEAGHPEMTIQGVDAALHNDVDRFTLDGTVTDPVWGVWSLKGSVERKSGIGTLVLSTPRRHVTQSMLESLPFVSAKVWKQVQCEGDTPAELTLRFDPQIQKLTSRIVLEPEKTKVHVSSINLSADNAHGSVVIENKVVKLANVQGQTAGGQIKTTANMDFREKPSQLAFHIEVEQADLVQLPKTWHLPATLRGRLEGHADLQVVVPQGKARTSGTGEGVITNGSFGGLRFSKIPILLHADEKGFRFSPQLPNDDKNTKPLSALPGTLPRK
jgi:hypothetical protein